jgi:hypothetical protein
LQPELLSTKKSGAEAALAVVKSLMSLVELIGTAPGTGINTVTRTAIDLSGFAPPSQ